MDKLIKVFVSYSRENSGWVVENGKYRLIPWLQKQRKEQVEIWTDQMLGKPEQIGNEYREKIETEVNSADIIVLLISQDFATSEFIRDYEVPFIRKRYSQKDFRPCAIIPLVIEPLKDRGAEHVQWIYDTLQVFPCEKERKCLLDFRARDNDWSEVKNKILEILDSKIKEVIPRLTSTQKALNKMYAVLAIPAVFLLVIAFFSVIGAFLAHFSERSWENLAVAAARQIQYSARDELFYYNCFDNVVICYSTTKKNVIKYFRDTRSESSDYDYGKTSSDHTKSPDHVKSTDPKVTRKVNSVKEKIPPCDAILNVKEGAYSKIKPIGVEVEKAGYVGFGVMFERLFNIGKRLPHGLRCIKGKPGAAIVGGVVVVGTLGVLGYWGYNNLYPVEESDAMREYLERPENWDTTIYYRDYLRTGLKMYE